MNRYSLGLNYMLEIGRRRKEEVIKPREWDINEWTRGEITYSLENTYPGNHNIILIRMQELKLKICKR